MIIFITIIHVIMCLALIAIVLLQTGKGASMGAAFGGGSNTIFGGAGPASFLNKITTVAAIVFMLTSFTLAILSSQGVSSSKVLDAAPIEQTQPASETATPATGEKEGTESTTPKETE
ncbi:preprotein translocase subunit SecG [candidate division KSB3 bacterium]|uniref:Protein-export membrane protein SecG n=1 Tax=candidate division KSB3 bacterium TaxID=2044937 RepID=A0A2G6KIK0_9BACT|nr:MAG: preprotein translocase subunit SecG [candidate division KSB3 bacterium]